MEFLPSIAAAFVAGFLGSAHCLGMCAGISGMIAVNAGVTALSTQLPLAITYNAGRVASYAVFGAIVAAFGDAIVSAMPRIGRPVQLLSGVIIVLVGLQVAFNWRLLAPVETAGLKLWQRIAPLAGRLLPVTTLPRAFGLGLLWGWLPCGLVYSVLLIAAASADIATGALVMTAFGLGTMPAMIATGMGALAISRLAGRARLAAGLAIVAMGVATVFFPINALLAGDAGGHAHHH